MAGGEHSPSFPSSIETQVLVTGTPHGQRLGWAGRWGHHPLSQEAGWRSKSSGAGLLQLLPGISAGFPPPPFAWWSQVYKEPSLPRVARFLGSTEGSEMLGRILLE